MIDWTQVLHPDSPRDLATAWVEKIAREHLSQPAFAERVARSGPVSTKEFVERLFPERSVIGPDKVAARQRLYDIVLKLANTGLSDCVTRGEPRKIGRFKTMGRPYLWGPPRPKPKPCPHCGGTGYEGGPDESV